RHVPVVSCARIRSGYAYGSQYEQRSPCHFHTVTLPLYNFPQITREVGMMVESASGDTTNQHLCIEARRA
ncbi:hypothetical protein BaRGS_00028774, partial [Batillaria attramentaria]